MKRFKGIGIIFISVFLCLPLANKSYGDCNSIDLDVPMYYQECNLWCWDASSQMILKYHGTTKSQTQIADWATPTEDCTWNWLCGQTSNPTRKGVNLILDYFGGLDSVCSGGGPGASTCNEELNADRPFVIRWEREPIGHHIVCKGIACGWGGPWLIINDPKDGPYWGHYQWVARGSGHTWTHTCYRIE